MTKQSMIDVLDKDVMLKIDMDLIKVLDKEFVWVRTRRPFMIYSKKGCKATTIWYLFLPDENGKFHILKEVAENYGERNIIKSHIPLEEFNVEKEYTQNKKMDLKLCSLKGRGCPVEGEFSAVNIF